MNKSFDGGFLNMTQWNQTSKQSFLKNKDILYNSLYAKDKTAEKRGFINLNKKLKQDGDSHSVGLNRNYLQNKRLSTGTAAGRLPEFQHDAYGMH